MTYEFTIDDSRKVDTICENCTCDDKPIWVYSLSGNVTFSSTPNIRIDLKKGEDIFKKIDMDDLVSIPKKICLLYTSPSPRDQRGSRMPSSA